jgi:hypothetical protein
MITVFVIPAAAFLAIGIAWAYFAIKAMRARRWAIAVMRALATAISFGGVVFEMVLVGNLLR